MIARHGLTYQEAFNTTLEAFRVYTKAYRIRMADTAYQSAMQAWNNQMVKNTKGSGNSIRPLYEYFIDFFDYEKELSEALGNGNVQRKRNTLADVNRLMNEYIERKGVVDDI